VFMAGARRFSMTRIEAMSMGVSDGLDFEFVVLAQSSISPSLARLCSTILVRSMISCVR